MKRSFWLRYSRELDRTMYWVIGLFGLAAALWQLADRLLFSEMPYGLLGPCLIHLVWRGYCPGCGGTRAVRALLAFRPVASLCYHPFVLYAVVLGAAFMVSRTTAKLRSEPESGMHFYYLYFGIAIGLYLVHFLTENILLLGFGIDIFEKIETLPF